MSENRGEIRIRKMYKGDLFALNDMDQAITSKGRVTTWPFSFETYWRVYEPKLVYVAELDGKVCGVLSGYIEQEERSKYLIRQPHEIGTSVHERKIGWIELMGIMPEYWHRGIGARLVEAFREECKKNNATMRIIIREDDKDLARFLEGVNFKKSPLVTYEDTSF